MILVRTQPRARRHAPRPFPAPTTGLEVKETDITNAKVQTRVDDPTQVFNILLRQNLRQLINSENSIVTIEEVKDKFVENA